MVDVAAGGKPAPFARHDDDSYGIVRADLGEDIQNFFSHRPAECVQLIRPVELDSCDWPVNRENDGFVHLTTWRV